MLEYWRPRLNKWVRYRTREGKEVLDANSNTYVEVKNELDPVILATRVRFHPYSHYRDGRENGVAAAHCEVRRTEMVKKDSP